MYIYNNISLNYYQNEKYFRQICGKDQNTRFRFNDYFFFRKSCRLRDNVEKYDSVGQAVDDSIKRRMRFTCWITNASDTEY